MALPTVECFKGLDLLDQAEAIYETLYTAAGDTSLTPPECFKGQDSLDQLTDIYSAFLAIGGGIPQEPVLPTSDCFKWLDQRDQLTAIYEAITQFTAPISPADIAGLALWLKADSIDSIPDGGAITTWPDLSGNLRDATQAVAIKKPTLMFNQINGKKVVRFDGTDDALVLPAFALTSSSIFVVTKASPAASSAYAPFIIVDNAQICVKLSSGNTWGTFVGADLSAGETLVFATPALVEMTSTAGATFLYQDGVQKNMAAGPSSGVNPGSIGDTTGFNRFLSADIAEIIVYSSVLSDSDRTLVEDYLTDAYFNTGGLTTPECFRGEDRLDQLADIYAALASSSPSNGLISKECFKGLDQRDQMTALYEAIVQLVPEELIMTQPDGVSLYLQPDGTNVYLMID
jgi:hypothetical protein